MPREVRLEFEATIENQLTTLANEIKALVPGAQIEGVHVG
jgi:hypothetical protein